MLTDAVATIAAGSGDPRTLAEHLADHINHVLINRATPGDVRVPTGYRLSTAASALAMHKARNLRSTTPPRRASSSTAIPTSSAGRSVLEKPSCSSPFPETAPNTSIAGSSGSPSRPHHRASRTRAVPSSLGFLGVADPVWEAGHRDQWRRPPVIIDEHGDIEVFRSGAAACAHPESIDVENVELDAFDAARHRLELFTARKYGHPDPTTSGASQRSAQPDRASRAADRSPPAAGRWSPPPSRSQGSNGSRDPPHDAAAGASMAG